MKTVRNILQPWNFGFIFFELSRTQRSITQMSSKNKETKKSVKKNEQQQEITLKDSNRANLFDEKPDFQTDDQI